MPSHNIMKFIKQLNRPIFTTYELTANSGKSRSTTTQALNYLVRQSLIIKICRGIWVESGNDKVSQYSIIPFLISRQRVYVSFISALHLYGIIEQIPQVITLASTSHTRVITTKLGTFSIHQISPKFFKGFDWYKGEGSFLIAEPEKALVDTLYLSAHKKRQFLHFPELNFPKSFSFKKVKLWINNIPNPKTRHNVESKIVEILKQSNLRHHRDTR